MGRTWIAFAGALILGPLTAALADSCTNPASATSLGLAASAFILVVLLTAATIATASRARPARVRAIGARRVVLSARATTSAALEAKSDAQFLRWSRVVIVTVAAVYLAQGLSRVLPHLATASSVAEMEAALAAPAAARFPRADQEF